MENKLEKIADNINEDSKRYSNKQNALPCTVCGSNEFVQKFRNVVGEITGSMHGYFSLFGGAVSGSIDGYTKTLPVLSCRKCENEREIHTWQYESATDVFWDHMRGFYFKGTTDDYFLSRPLETRRYMLENRNYEYRFYNELPDRTVEQWASHGFKIDKIKKKKFLFWESEVYPTWKELEELSNNQS